MGLVVTGTGGGDFEVAPSGNHPAVCTRVIDLGTIHDKRWDKWKHKVLIGWELAIDERQEDGKRFMVFERYTASLHKKSALSRDLLSWRGIPFTDEDLAAFDLKNIAGKPCLLSVTHNDTGDRVYANIASVARIPKQMEKPNPEGDVAVFSVDDPDMSVFDTFSDNLKSTIKGSQEWQERESAPSKIEVAASLPMTEDDIPF